MKGIGMGEYKGNWYGWDMKEIGMGGYEGNWYVWDIKEIGMGGICITCRNS